MNPFADHSNRAEGTDAERVEPHDDSTELGPYPDQLAAALHSHQLDPVRIGGVLAETHTHLLDSGESPVDAFGTPDTYAAAIAASQPSYEASEWEEQTFPATSADEREVLARVGRHGWELVGCGAFALHCRRPSGANRTDGAPGTHQWEYQRRTAMRPAEITKELKRDGWSLVGGWPPFWYFKRPLHEPAETGDTAEQTEDTAANMQLSLTLMFLGLATAFTPLLGTLLPDDPDWLSWAVLGVQFSFIAAIGVVVARYTNQRRDRTGAATARR